MAAMSPIYQTWNEIRALLEKRGLPASYWESLPGLSVLR
jgi:hypothetical protein